MSRVESKVNPASFSTSCPVNFNRFNDSWELGQPNPAHVTLSDNLDFDLSVSRRWLRLRLRFWLRLRLSSRGFGGRQPPDLRLSPIGQTEVTQKPYVAELSLKVTLARFFCL